MQTIAITLGDAGGIGPEIALKACHKERWPKNVRFVLVGSRLILREQAKRLRLPMPVIWNSARRAGIQNWDPPNRHPTALQWNPGATGRPQGLAAADWIASAVRGCMEGMFHAMVTGPICKKSLALAGLPYPGHTEYLAHLTGTRHFAMMLMGGALRVVLATRHIPLALAPTSISRQTIMEAAQLTAQGTAWLGLKNQKIGICALNPHAGDGGLLGREEITIITPAIRALQRKGLDVEGPVPADVIFYQAIKGRFGAIVAMFHDQGLAPLKMIGFETGINLTLGLPIVRVSPDHGTAFDIAGRGTANPSSMIAALHLAIRLARRKNPWT